MNATAVIHKADLNAIKADLTKEIQDIKSSVRVLTWMLGFLLATAVPVALKAFSSLIH